MCSIKKVHKELQESHIKLPNSKAQFPFYLMCSQEETQSEGRWNRDARLDATAYLHIPFLFLNVTFFWVFLFLFLY